MNFDNLVAVLAVAAAVPLILAAVPRVRVPGPVLEIVAGIVLGPAVLDLVKPDQAVRLVSTIGLAFLLFLAGLEIDVCHFRGPRARLAGLALGVSALLALIIGIVLHATGVVENPLLVGIILLATSLGLITPILEDAGVADRPVGQFAIAGASLGELSPVVLLSLFFSGRTTAIGSKLLLLSLLGVLVVLVVIGTLRIERSMRITRMINKLADTSAQIRIRLSILLVVGLGALATHLGFEAILGAFIAGAILRLVDADAEHKHPLFHPKLDAIGYGFLIPVFFVTSGLTFNLSVLFSSASTLLRVPLFLLALLVVRGLPAILYRSALASIREVAAAGLLQATSLPFIVAATTIGLQLHAIRPANAAALVAAGLLSVILFPVISLQLLGHHRDLRPGARLGPAPARRGAQRHHPLELPRGFRWDQHQRHRPVAGPRGQARPPRDRPRHRRLGPDQGPNRRRRRGRRHLQPGGPRPSHRAGLRRVRGRRIPPHGHSVHPRHQRPVGPLAGQPQRQGPDRGRVRQRHQSHPQPGLRSGLTQPAKLLDYFPYLAAPPES